MVGYQLPSSASHKAVCGGRGVGDLYDDGALRGVCRMKACIVVFQYMQSYWQAFPAGSSTTSYNGAYTGRMSVKAPKLKSGTIKELQIEGPTLNMLEKALIRILRHYNVDKPELDKIMVARTNLLAAFGRLALRIGRALEEEAVKAAAMRRELSTQERLATVQTTLKGVLADIEDKYRKALVDAGTYENVQALPPALNPKEEQKKDEEKKKDQIMTFSAGGVVASGSEGLTHFEINLTPEAVEQRLGIVDFNAEKPIRVGLRSVDFLGDAEDEFLGELGQAPGGADAEANADEAQAKAQPKKKLHTAELHKLEEKDDGVEASIVYGGREYRVDSDLLLKLEQEEKKKELEQEEKQEVPPMQWESITVDCARQAGLWALDQAMVQCFSAVQGVVIEQVGKAEVAPIKLRLKTTRDFKAGELILVPHLGRFTSSMFLQKTSSLCVKYQEADKQEMHASSLPQAFVRVVSQEQGKKRGKGEETWQEEAIQETFFANSPLFMTRKGIKDRNPVTTNLNPFWALARSLETAEVNMRMQPFIVKLEPPKKVFADSIKWPSPLKGPMFSVSVQVAVNSRRLGIGEYLYVTSMREDPEA